MALLANWIAPHDPYILVCDPYQKPSALLPLGCDDIGHDILSQLIFGSRIPLIVGLGSSILATSIGVSIGILAGYIGEIVDTILMRLTDIVLTIPYLVFVIVLVAYLGPNLWNMILSIGLLGWPSIARMVRSQVISLKTRLYVEVAVALGASRRYIMLRYIVLDLVPLIIPLAVLTILDGILTEAGLSFLGLGDPTQVSWGLLLYYAALRGGFITGAWWWILPPGLMITVTSLAMMSMSQGLDDALNPKKGTR